MRKRTMSALFALTLLLAGCDRALQKQIDQATPVAADRNARALIERLPRGDENEIRPLLDPLADEPDVLEGFRQLATGLAGYRLGEGKLIGTQWSTQDGIPVRDLVYEVPMTLAPETVGFDPGAAPSAGPMTQYMIATVTVRDRPDDYRVLRVNITNVGESQASLNAFGNNLRAPQLLFLLLAAGALVVQFYAIARVVKSDIRRKWLWVLASCLGVARIVINWTTGASWFTAFSVTFPVIGFNQYAVDGPLFLRVGLPAGGFWALEAIRRHNRKKRALSRPATVVFACEYGSKKSVLAAAYFNHVAEERELPHRAVARGLDPDPAIPENIKATLRDQGVDFEDVAPTRLETSELPHVRMIVSFSEAPGDLATGDAEMRSWADIRPLAAGFDRVRDQIRSRAEALVDELVARDAPAAGLGPDGQR